MTYRRLVRAMDVLEASIFLILLGPVMLATLLAIKLTRRGPAVFAQERVGRHGRRYEALRFRIGVYNKEADGATFKIHQYPPPITVGGFLSSLAELPQFLNVLRGDMSLHGRHRRSERDGLVETGSGVAERLHRRSFAVLDAWSVVLPMRVVNEDLGDYLEDISSRAAQRQRVLVWLRVVTAIVWTGVNAVGYALKQLGRTKAT